MRALQFLLELMHLYHKSVKMEFHWLWIVVYTKFPIELLIAYRTIFPWLD